MCVTVREEPDPQDKIARPSSTDTQIHLHLSFLPFAFLYPLSPSHPPPWISSPLLRVQFYLKPSPRALGSNPHSLN